MGVESFDIIVVGGGAAGVSAACAASVQGNSVALIDRNVQLGGLATNAEVGTICGLYINNQSIEFTYNAGRFAEAFAEELMIRSSSSPELDNTGLKYLPYIPEHFKSICEELLRENNVRVLTGAELTGVTVSANEINSLVLEQHGESIIYKAKAVIDSTGVSRVSKLLGLPVMETEFRQAASQVFTVKGCEFGSEKNMTLVLLKALRTGVLNGELSDFNDRVYLIPGSLRKDRVSLKITVPAPMNEEYSKRELKEKANETIELIFAYLRRNVDGFKNAEIDSIASAVGIRVGDRAEGMQILCDDDVLGCKKSKQSIARGNWPVEIWSEAKRVQLRHLKEDDYYDIPAKCLVSAQIDNLFYAGRCISATDNAIASARVIGTCMQTGYAAGMLAAGKINKESLDASVLKIQQDQF